MKKLITFLLTTIILSSCSTADGYNKKPFIITGKNRNHPVYGLTEYKYVDSSGCGHYFIESDYDKVYFIGDTLK